MSNTAWETTTEDVEMVLATAGIDSSSPQFFDADEWDDFIDECMGAIDFDLVEKSALNGDDMLEQTEYASESIEEQLIDAGKM